MDEYGDRAVWSLFGHRRDDGAWCIGDYQTREDAVTMAQALSATPQGVPVE